jgi:hypothetical protein
MEGQPVGLQRPAVAAKPSAGGENGLAVAEEADAAASWCAVAAKAPRALSLSTKSASR